MNKTARVKQARSTASGQVDEVPTSVQRVIEGDRPCLMLVVVQKRQMALFGVRMSLRRASSTRVVE